MKNRVSRYCFFKLFFLFLFLSQGLVAQDFSAFQADESEAVDHYALGISLFDEGKYYESVFYLEQASKQRMHRKNMYLFYQLAEASRRSRLYDKALDAYTQVVEQTEHDSLPLALLYLSQMQMVAGQYNEAKKHADWFLQVEGLDSLYYRKAQRLIQSVQQIDVLTADTALYDVSLLPREVNVNPSNYGGSWLGDRIWYTSSVEVFDYQSVQFDQGEAVYESFFIDRLFSSRQIDGQFSEGLALENLMYSRTSNYLPPVFSPDGDRIYTSVCKKLGKQGCWIYWSDYEQGGAIDLEWVDEPVNHFESSSKDPAVVELEGLQLMFFSSDREGNGYDLYYVLFDSVSQEPGDLISMGKKVNTAGNEISPFYDTRTKTLFFSSDGRAGTGLFDVYAVQGCPFTGWDQVKHLGALNSPFDDYYYHQITHFDHIEGFLSSNRIKESTCCDQLYAFEKENRYLPVNIDVKGCHDTIQVSSFTVQAIPLGFDKPYVAQELDTSFVSLSLIQERPYRIIVNSSGYQSFETEIFPENASHIQVHLKPTQIQMFVQINGHQMKSSVRDGMLFFHADSGGFEKQVETEQGYYSMELGLSENDYMNVLVSARLHHTDSFPIRFSEEEICAEKAERVFVLQTMDIGGDILKNRIEFKTASFDIKEKSFPELDRLAAFLLKHDDISLEVQGHTDNVGSFGYNQYLSQNRSESITRYLQEKGVEASRLTAKGYSFSDPIATNETSEGRAKNRRVGFKVTAMDAYTREVMEANQQANSE